MQGSKKRDDVVVKELHKEIERQVNRGAIAWSDHCCTGRANLPIKTGKFQSENSAGE